MISTHRVVACSLLLLTAGLSAPALAQVRAFSGIVDRKCTQLAYFTQQFESKGELYDVVRAGCEQCLKEWLVDTQTVVV